MINLRRVYEFKQVSDGYSVLIDRLWPRGISKEKKTWDEWDKEIAPSDDLRKWYHHDTSKWNEFRKLYRKELAMKSDELKKLKSIEKTHGTLTLLYSAKDTERNNALVLKEVLQEL